MPKEALINDKVIHFAVFCVLGMLAAWRLAAARSPVKMRAACGWFVAFVVYAMVDEVTQPLVGRTFEWLDLTADAAGALIGLTSAALIFRFAAGAGGGDTDAE